MTALNLSKDQIAMLLLKNIIQLASHVSFHDVSLNKQIASLQAAYSNPVGVDYDALYSSILKLSEILSGYDIRKSDLPAIIFKFKNQIEELKVETDLKGNHFHQALLKKVDEFYKKAFGG